MTNKDDRIAEIMSEWYERQGDPEELIRAHPDLADELRGMLGAMTHIGEAWDDGDGPAGPGPAEEFADFRIVRELGRGGMGVVYEAEQISMQRRVALKVLSVTITSAPHAVKRFEREARAAGRLHHTNIVPVYGMGRHAGHSYYAMELIQGRPLSAVIAELRGHRPSEESLARAAVATTPASDFGGTGTGDRAYFTRVAQIFAAVADALELAHEQGVIHRDIKPANLLLDPDGTLKIVDFGLARLDDDLDMTITGDLLGTPVYMSPEQAMAKRIAIDKRTDIYSLGATMYEALTLQPPFAARNLQDLCSQIITKDPLLPRRRNRHVPRDLETIVLKAMDKDRDRRYATARELARDLRAFAEGEAIRARRIGPLERGWRRVKRHKVRSALVAAVTLLAVAAAALGLRTWRDTERQQSLDYARACALGYEALQRRIAQSEVLADERPEAVFTRAIALQPDRPDGYLGRALVPDWEGRAADLERARELGLPDDTYRLARLCLQEGRWAANVDETWLREAALGPPENAYLASLVLETQGQLAAALELLDDAILRSREGQPIQHLARFARARVRASLGDFAGSLTDLAILQAAGDDSIDTRVKVAKSWRRLGDEQQWDAVWRDILRDIRANDNEAAWFALFRAMAALGLPFEDREPVVREAVERFPDSARLLAARAMTFAHGMPVEQRRAMAERASRLAPESAFVWDALGQVYWVERRPALAVEAFERVIELNPQASRGPLQRMGGALLWAGRYEEAVACLRRSIAARPGSWAYWCLGQAFVGLEEYEMARDALERSLELRPNHLSVRADLAHVLGLMGDHAAARAKLLDPTLEEGPRAAAGCDRAAEILVTSPVLELRHPRRAVELARHAVKMAPTRGFMWRTLGIALGRTGDWKGALQALEKSMDLEFGRDAFTWFFVAIAHRHLGHEEEAREWFDRAVAWMEERAPTHRKLLRFRAEAADLLGG